MTITFYAAVLTTVDIKRQLTANCIGRPWLNIITSAKKGSE